MQYIAFTSASAVTQNLLLIENYSVPPNHPRVKRQWFLVTKQQGTMKMSVYVDQKLIKVAFKKLSP